MRTPHFLLLVWLSAVCLLGVACGQVKPDLPDDDELKPRTDKPDSEAKRPDPPDPRAGHESTSKEDKERRIREDEESRGRAPGGTYEPTPGWDDPSFGKPKVDRPRFGDGSFGVPKSGPGLHELTEKEGAEPVPSLDELRGGIGQERSPGAAGGFAPRLVVGRKEPHLVWLRRGEGSTDRGGGVLVSTWSNNEWGDGDLVAESGQLLLGDAHRPAAIGLPEGGLAVAWVEAAEEGEHIVLRSRPLRGEWSEPVRIEGEASVGFVEMTAQQGDGEQVTLEVVWKARGETEDSVALRHSRVVVAAEGLEPAPPETLDGDTCEGSGAPLADLGEGDLLVAVRDETSEGSVVALHRLGGAARTWSLAQSDSTEHAAERQTPCLARSGDNVAVAWLNVSDDVGEVMLVRSRDGGASFTPAVKLNRFRCMGGVELAWLDDGDLAVAWVERLLAGLDRQQLVVVRVQANGRVGERRVIIEGELPVVGQPSMVRDRRSLHFAWTGSDGLKVARLPHAELDTPGGGAASPAPGDRRADGLPEDPEARKAEIRKRLEALRKSREARQRQR